MLGSQGWGVDKRVQFQEPYNKMPKPSGTASGAWKPAVPFWERQFCESVGLSWDQVCDNNNELEGFEHILRWDDSAALESLQMAKRRYWQRLNGLPCDIPLPSPDLYIDEVDWSSRNQEDCDLPVRDHSSSEEEYRRPYFKRGRRGRQGRGRNMSRLENWEHKKPSDSNAYNSVNVSLNTGWPDDNNNAPIDARMPGSMEWSENRKSATDLSKDVDQNPNNATIQPTGWEDDSGCDVKQTDPSGWEVHGNNDANSTGWDQKMDSRWGNQTEPTRNSTLTSKTGRTDSSNVVGNSVVWGDQTQLGLNNAVGGSGWISHEEEKYTGQGWGNEDSGRGSKPVGTTGWTNAKNVPGWESGVGCASHFIPQEQVVATGWGDQFPESVRPYYQNHAFMSAQWNSMPQAAQQWQNQSATWNAGPANMQYQFSGNWGGPPCNSYHQGGSQGWFQPAPYSQNARHPTNSNQGYWHPQSQHKQGGYRPTNHHYAPKKDRDYRVSNRRNQR